MEKAKVTIQLEYPINKPLVVISNEEYQELLDFKKNTNSGKIMTVIDCKFYSLFRTERSICFYTKEELFDEIKAINQKLNEELEKAKNQIHLLTLAKEAATNIIERKEKEKAKTFWQSIRDKFSYTKIK